jgi:ketosteroid isomerase-like protein
MSDTPDSLLNDFYDALNSDDIESAVGLCDPNVEVWLNPDVVAALPPRGHKEVADYLRGWFDSWDQYIARPDAFKQQGDQVVVMVQLRARGKGSRTSSRSSTARSPSCASTSIAVSRSTQPASRSSRSRRVAAGRLASDGAPATASDKEGMLSLPLDRDGDVARHVYDALEDEFAQPLAGIERAVPEGVAAFTELEISLSEWSYAYGVAWALVRAREPFLSSSRVGELADQAVATAWRAFSEDSWRTVIARERRMREPEPGDGTDPEPPAQLDQFMGGLSRARPSRRPRARKAPPDPQP